MKLELVPIPVSDVDASLAFYTEVIRFHLDHDVTPSEGVRVVQLTPPGSACSVLLSTGLPGVEMAPGSLRGLHLVVQEIQSVRAELLDRGVEVSEVVDMGGVLFAGFADPDGNTWVLQEIPRG
ncbi:MAG: VOC family protein [Rhodothermales bacterium]|nr:VOC family protein [Rhodothermales bacterium]MBO6781481.1 VOC family protein [Rhodothermales bacterium]